MKTFFKVSVLGLLMVVLTAASFSTAMAQTDDEQKEKEALYNTFVANYKIQKIENAQKALDAAKQYVAKFPDDTQYVDYFKPQITYLEKWIVAEEARIKAQEEAEKRKIRLNRFDSAYKAAVKTVNNQTWDEVFTSGQEIINNDKDIALDAKILLAAAGSAYLAEANPPINDFNNKIINYAEAVISDLDSGKTSKNFGVYNFEFKDKDKTLGAMNVVIGFIKYYRQQNEDAAIPYYYQSTKYNKNWNGYRIIGAWYLSKAVKLGEERKKLDPAVPENEAKAKEMVEMEMGYAERAIDAYARSYSLIKADAKATEVQKTAIYDKLKELFAFRYINPKDEIKKSEANINSFVANIDKKAMPNPSSTVTPVKLEEDAPSDKTDDAKKDEAKTSGMKTDGATRSRTVSKATTDN